MLEPLSLVLNKIAAASTLSPGAVQLVAVSKMQPVQKIIEFYRSGQKIFGENYVQELIEKSNTIRDLGINDIDFHFIGKLQSNKVKSLLPWVSTIHSVDSIRLLEVINRRSFEIAKKIKIYIQVNIDQETSKSGFVPKDLEAVFAHLGEYTSVEVLGLMCIPDPNRDPGHAFKEMRKIATSLGKWSTRPWGLSMGMSTDYELACREGSTCVRVGSALFGERPQKYPVHRVTNTR
jgi:pyridoxal phosphate enzyme (YggS family)